MIAIKNNDFELTKYMLNQTVQKKFKKQLDFNNGNGDILESEDSRAARVIVPDYIVDK